jgi:hypothetical protein
VEDSHTPGEVTFKGARFFGSARLHITAAKAVDLSDTTFHRHADLFLETAKIRLERIRADANLALDLRCTSAVLLTDAWVTGRLAVSGYALTVELRDCTLDGSLSISLVAGGRFTLERCLCGGFTALSVVTPGNASIAQCSLDGRADWRIMALSVYVRQSSFNATASLAFRSGEVHLTSGTRFAESSTLTGYVLCVAQARGAPRRRRRPASSVERPW